MKRLLGTEQTGGRTEKWWLHVGDDGNDRITVETIQDVEPILAENQRLYNSAPEKFGKGAFHEVARIPVTVLEETCRIKHIQFRELVAAKTDQAKSIWRELLNAREFRHFRTRPGRVDMTHGA